MQVAIIGEALRENFSRKNFDKSLAKVFHCKTFALYGMDHTMYAMGIFDRVSVRYAING